MRIIILDTLINQVNERKIPTSIIRRLYDEFYILSRLEKRGPIAIVSYLKNNVDGIKMRGSNGKGEIPIFKFRLSSGDRILYTYGKYLNYISSEDNSIVLLEFSKHGSQAKIAKTHDYRIKHGYDYIQNIVKNIKMLDDEDISEEDLRATVSILLSENFKGYAYTDEELKRFSVNEIDRYVILSREQEDVKRGITASLTSKNCKSASLIIGGAGTGKTLISLRLLNSFNECNDDFSAVYFTQSKELLKKVKKQYYGISKKNNSNNIEFYNINDFCIEQLKFDYSRFFATKDFLLFLQSTNPYAINIKRLRTRLGGVDDMMIWTEIRGILKGSMGNGTTWKRTSLLNQKDYSNCISYLFKEGYLERVSIGGDKKYFKLRYSVEKTKEILKDDFEYSTNHELKRETEKILEHFSNFDYSIRIISKEEYLVSSNEISVLSTEQRSIVYEIALIYDSYLKENNLFDENDLVREMFANSRNSFSKYNLVIVDEVQDYTELQIFLTQKISLDKYNIIFAGDIHQIINPTIFDIARLKSLYLDDNNIAKLDIYYLCKNFRCQQGIVNIANKISQLRRKIIGRKVIEVEREETSADSIIYSLPYRLKWNESNFMLLIKELIKYPDVAILVSTELEKKYLLLLISQLNIKDDDKDLLKIFTISEIKGIEYSYIVCFNMIKSFKSIFNHLLVENKNVKSKETKNRFCFNSIYVATTRAQHHLCFIDELIIDEFDKILNLETIDNFDSEKLYFDTLNDSLEEWYLEAIKLKDGGKYEEAIKYFLRSGRCDVDSEICDCKAELALSKKDFNTAVLYFILEGDMPSAGKYINEKTVSQELRVYYNFVINKSFSKNVVNIIKTLSNGLQENEKEIMNRLSLDIMERILVEKKDLFNVPEV